MKPTTFKIIIVGPAKCGKTSLRHQLAPESSAREFHDEYRPTIGVDVTNYFFDRKKVADQENASRFQIWDTAGEEKYKSITPGLLSASTAAIFCVDLTTNIDKTVKQKIKAEIVAFKNLNQSNKPAIILVGTKSDKIQVLKQEFDAFAEEFVDESGTRLIDASIITSALAYAKIATSDDQDITDTSGMVRLRKTICALCYRHDENNAEWREAVQRILTKIANHPNKAVLEAALLNVEAVLFAPCDDAQSHDKTKRTTAAVNFFLGKLETSTLGEQQGYSTGQKILCACGVLLAFILVTAIAGALIGFIGLACAAWVSLHAFIAAIATHSAAGLVAAGASLVCGAGVGALTARSLFTAPKNTQAPVSQNRDTQEMREVEAFMGQCTQSGIALPQPR